MRSLAQNISGDYKEKKITIVPVLKGSLTFCEALTKHIQGCFTVDPVRVKSYSGDRPSGRFRFLKYTETDPAKKDILLVEDIVDSGRTLSVLIEHFLSEGAASVRTCVLLDKPQARKHEVRIDYRGFVIHDAFVVGYGLDYNNRFRELPFVGVLRKEVYSQCGQ